MIVVCVCVIVHSACLFVCLPDCFVCMLVSLLHVFVSACVSDCVIAWLYDCLLQHLAARVGHPNPRGR